MRHVLQVLSGLALLSFAASSPAESACGSDTSPDPDVARGKDVWLNGHCKSFLPCRLVLAQFHACQAAENFLANLGAKEGVPLTDSQVEDALVRSTSKAGGSVPRMAKISASTERDRVAALDSSTLAALQSDCADRACMNYREKQLNLLSSEVEKLNGNPDILYWFPEYAPVQAFAAAQRLGWTKQNGQWVPGGTRESVTTLGQYLLSVPECQKLRDRLDREVKANPAREPDNLSFFEGECVPQLAAYADDLRNWRASLVAPASDAKPGTTSAAPSPPAGDGSPGTGTAIAPDPGLEHWHAGLVAAEKEHQVEMAAAAEARQRAQDEKASAEAEAARQRKVAMAAAEREAARNGWVLPSDCQTEQASVRHHQDLDGTGNGTEQSITDALRRPWVYRWGGKNGEMTVAELLETEQGYLRSIAQDESRIAQCRAATGLDRIMCPTEETSSIRMNRLTACAYRVAAARRAGNVPPSASAAPVPSSDAVCETKLKSIDDQVGGAIPRCGESATCNLQAAMWGLGQQISTIEGHCPSGKFAAKLADARNQLESVTTTCNQIVSGGRCSPKL